MAKTTTNTTTNKVDFFSSSKELSARTAEFFRVVIKKTELNTVYGEKIASNEASIAAITDMKNGNTKLSVSNEELDSMTEKYIKLNEDLKTEWKKLLEEQANFEYDDEDKAFKKSMKSASCQEDVKKAIRVFFKAYKLEVADTTFEASVLDAIGKKVAVKTIVKSNGRKALSYDVSNALKNLYAVGFEAMVEAGTIKPAEIPSILTDRYCKKSTKKSN